MKAPEYQSPDSVGKRPTLPIDADDPRLRWDKKGQTLARSGREVQEVSFAGGGGFAALQSQVNVLQEGGNIVQGSVAGPDYTPVIAYGSYLGVYPGGEGPYILVPTDPGVPTLSWVGDTLQIVFDYDVSNPINITVSQFIVKIIAEGISASTPLNTFLIDRSQNTQTLLLTSAINTQMFNMFETNITSLTVMAADPLGNISNAIAAISMPSAWAPSFSAPSAVTLTQATGGYTFSLTNIPSSPSYDAIDVWEIESNDASQPAIVYKSDGITPSNYNRVYFQNINPVFVSSPNGNQRYVAVRFSSKARKYTDFTLLGATTPKGSANFDPTAPNPPASASGAWLGDDLQITYKLDSLKPGTRLGIQLAYTDSSNIAYTGTFYFFPDSTNTTTNQIATIHKADMFAQFGAYYSSFSSSLIFTTSLAGVQSSTSQFSIATKSNPLKDTTPTVTANAAANGYIVTWNQSVGTYADVYAKTSPWTSYPADESQRVYSGKSPVTIQSLDYSNTQYILIRLYNDYGQTSDYSLLTTVVSAKPYDPGALSLIDQPVTFQTNGSILAGNLGSQRVIFNQSGLFAYGSDGVTPTTEIINTASGNTFMTKQAQIADWQITASKIENTVVPLGSSAQTYTGLSGTGSYAFWAGGTQTSTTGPISDASAAFWVKPNGSVQATNISIKGGSLDIGGSTTVVKSVSGTSGQSTVTVSDNTGIYTGMYLLANGVSGLATVTSINSNTITMSLPNTGTVNGNGYFVSSAGAHITGSGILVAAGATLSGNIVATSGLFSGDVGIGASGALYSGTLVTSGQSAKGNVKSGYVLSSNGLTFYDSNASYVTDINGATGRLTTSSASIGSWNVNGTSIYAGTLTLDSQGIIKVSAFDSVSYTAGIASATKATDNVFWAGTGGSSSQSNNFRVRMDGTLYAKSGVFTGGSVTSTGSLGTISIDGDKDLISLATAGSTSYIMPRNGNIYIISPSTELPWGSITANPAPGGNGVAGTNGIVNVTSGGVITTAPTSKPYFVAGSSFKDAWGSTVNGVGIYTGNWDYFSSPNTSSPFITATTTGLHLSGSPKVGIIIEPGGKSGSALSNPSVLIYTSTNSSSKWSPTTTYGAYMLAEPTMITMYSNNIASGSFPDGGIIINGSGTNSIHGVTRSSGVYIYAGSSGTQKAYAGFNNNGIVLQSNTAATQQIINDTSITLQTATAGATPITSYIKLDNTGIKMWGGNASTPTSPTIPGTSGSEVYRAYASGSAITLGTGVDSLRITGMPIQGNTFSVGIPLTAYNDGQWPDLVNGGLLPANSTFGLGTLARQRMLVEDPYDGVTRLGMAVYYQDMTVTAHSSNPGASSGAVGDLWVQF